MVHVPFPLAHFSLCCFLYVLRVHGCFHYIHSTFISSTGVFIPINGFCFVFLFLSGVFLDHFFFFFNFFNFSRLGLGRISEECGDGECGGSDFPINFLYFRIV